MSAAATTRHTRGESGWCIIKGILSCDGCDGEGGKHGWLGRLSYWSEMVAALSEV